MEKTKNPAFLFYSQDFLVGCSDLTMVDRGKYITLLCLQHQKGHLNERTIKLNIGYFSPQLKFKFVIDKDGNYYNERLDSEIKKRNEFKKKQSLNALQSAAKVLPTMLPKGFQINAKTVPLENVNEYRRIIPPPKELVELYCNYRNNGIKASDFVDFYEARGWEYGRGKPIRDWQAAIRTWESKRPKRGVVNLKELDDERKYHIS